MAVGLGLVAGAVVWVATRPSMSPEARMRQLHEIAPVEQTGPAEEPNEQPVVSVIARSPEPNLPPPEPALPETPPLETPTQEAVVAVEKPDEGVFDSTVHEQTEKIETQRFHIVRRGDTLSRVSVTYYGSAGQWQKIFEANRETIANPDKLTPGQKLIIPE
ncbi:MAG TPA: LysM peptidoglycan-binding domain-containing protein [Sedimentisphaerales bacterium]|nr:LysM peptidoglycan-binding domain-containing protein [Sedimentisphaerales bacterium]